MLDLTKYPTLHASRAFSKNTVDALRQAFENHRTVLAPLAAIGAAGSLGRLEAGPDSDLDAICLLDASHASTHQLEAAMECVWEIATGAGLRVPKHDGIFRDAVVAEQLLNLDSLGKLDESPSIFGKRIQILLDTRALSGHDYLVDTRRRVLDWYAWPFRNLYSEGLWEYLLSDLIRYANAYRNWQAVKLNRTADDSWALRHAKLRSTRLVTWLGLWGLILRAMELRQDGFEWMLEHLELTPLERIALLIDDESPVAMVNVLTSYESIMVNLQNPDVRARLIRSGPPYSEGQQPFHCEEFRQILQHSDALREALTQFFAARFARASSASQRMALPF